MSGSWVMRTMVLPSSLSSWKMPMISMRGARVEVAGRLVGQEDGRVGDERAGDGDALLLAAGELRGVVAFAAGQADVVQRGRALLRGAARFESARSP